MDVDAIFLQFAEMDFRCAGKSENKNKISANKKLVEIL